MKACLQIILPVLAALAANSGHAQLTAISNLENLSNGPSEVYYEASPSTGDDWGQAFTTGSAANLFSVTVTIQLVDGQPPNTGGFTVALYSDVAGLPGTELAALTGNSNPLTPGQYTYTDTQHTPLSSSTAYWIVASVPQTAPEKDYGWSYTLDSNTQGQAGWSLGSSGVNRYVGGTPVGWITQPDTQVMAVTIVPEPRATGLVMALLASSALVLLKFGKQIEP